MNADLLNCFEILKWTRKSTSNTFTPLSWFFLLNFYIHEWIKCTSKSLQKNPMELCRQNIDISWQMNHNWQFLRSDYGETKGNVENHETLNELKRGLTSSQWSNSFEKLHKLTTFYVDKSSKVTLKPYNCLSWSSFSKQFHSHFLFVLFWFDHGQKINTHFSNCREKVHLN